MHKSLLIEYENQLDSVVLEFKLRDNPVVERWIERVKTAQEKYQIDGGKATSLLGNRCGSRLFANQSSGCLDG